MALAIQGISMLNKRRWQWPILHVKQLAVFRAKGLLENHCLGISFGCCIAVHVAGGWNGMHPRKRTSGLQGNICGASLRHTRRSWRVRGQGHGQWQDCPVHLQRRRIHTSNAAKMPVVVA